MPDKVQEVVACAIDRLNELLPSGDPLPKDQTTVLLGQTGRLDSMGFVNLIVALEEELDRQLGIKANLVDEVMMPAEGLYTVGDIHKLLIRLINDRSPGRTSTGNEENA